MLPLCDEIARSGYAIVAGVIGSEERESVLAELESLAGSEAARGGVRNVLQRSAGVRALATSPRVRELVQSVLGEPPFAVRGIYFRKVGGVAANWAVGWHRDHAIPLASGTTEAAVAAAGLHGFSVKDGVPHAIAPQFLLADMLTVRLHLDAADAENGALQVLPGSHVAAGDERPHTDPVTCSVGMGGALVMRPLLWHASAKATAVRPRRVLHLEFASAPLPGGLQWRERV